MVFHKPVQTAYVVVSKTSTRVRYRRNPYYPKVDPAGNQLPYIDYLEVQRVDSPEIMAAKAATGQIDFAGRQFKTADIPLFKRFEQDNGYETYLWPRPYGSDVTFMPNMTHPDERLRQLFQDVRFRRALSLAINREEINDIAYYGQGIPRQLTVVSSSRYFEPSFAAAWAEHDPQRARALLDEMGLIDRNGDGRREHPDGRPLEITLEYTIGETPKQVTVDLVTAHWREVGLHINRKQISGALQGIRTRGGVMDMSIWHADRNADILFPIEPFWYVPMHVGPGGDPVAGVVAVVPVGRSARLDAARQGPGTNRLVGSAAPHIRPPRAHRHGQKNSPEPSRKPVGARRHWPGATSRHR